MESLLSCGHGSGFESRVEASFPDGVADSVADFEEYFYYVGREGCDV